MGPAAATVLGLGNLLLGDDGFGVHVLRRLEVALGATPGVTLVDGGTLGVDLLEVVEESTYLVVVDAAVGGMRPGTVTVLEGDAATDWDASAFSSHDLALPSVFAMARLRGWAPQAVAVVAVEPDAMAVTIALTPPVEAAVVVAVETVRCLLVEWGVEPLPVVLDP